MTQDDAPADEPKSERFNMFISKSEMDAIDDWAWKNRIRSKSDAVRRLIQMGLIADENIDPLASALNEASAAISKSLEELIKASEGFEPADLADPMRHYFAQSAAAAISVVDQLSLLGVVINGILRQVVATKSASNISDARLAAMAEKARGIEKVSEAILEIYKSAQRNVSGQRGEAPE